MTADVLALFDLDHTLLPIDSADAWSHFLVYAGGLVSANALDTILSAARIEMEHESNVRFVFVGGGQDKRASLVHGAAGGVQRSFVGSPWLCQGLRCLRMTATKIGTRIAGSYALKMISPPTARFSTPQCRTKNTDELVGLSTPNPKCKNI